MFTESLTIIILATTSITEVFYAYVILDVFVSLSSEIYDQAELGLTTTVLFTASLFESPQSFIVTVIVLTGLRDQLGKKSQPLEFAARYFRLPDPDYNGFLQGMLDAALPPLAPADQGLLVPFRIVGLSDGSSQRATICLSFTRFGTESTRIKVNKVFGDEGPLRQAVEGLASLERRYPQMLPGAAVIKFIDEELAPTVAGLPVQLELPLARSEVDCG